MQQLTRKEFGRGGSSLTLRSFDPVSVASHEVKPGGEISAEALLIRELTLAGYSGAQLLQAMTAPLKVPTESL